MKTVNNKIDIAVIIGFSLKVFSKVDGMVDSRVYGKISGSL